MTSFKMTGLGGENTLKSLKETQCLSMDGAMVSFFFVQTAIEDHSKVASVRSRESILLF